MAQNFIESLPEAVSYKIYSTSSMLQVVNATRNFLRSWRIRKYGSSVHYKTAYRLFAFGDKDKETLVIATHGISKKTTKTPSKEIAKADAIGKEYFKNK